VGGRPRASTRDDGNVHDIGDRRCEIEVVASASAIAIDARDEQLAGATLDALACPAHRIERRGRPAASRIYAPTVAITFGIDARDDALRAESLGALRQNLRRLDCGGVDGDLVRTGA
jgi:hypothetical protein